MLLKYFMVRIGIIGGSGLDNPDLLKEVHEVEINTPFGKPSSPLKLGRLNEIEIVLLARHGREHTIPPTQVNFQANIEALKMAGCTHILATTACGSLKEEIERGDLIILDQFIDFTRHRKVTFHEEFLPHKAVHTPMAEPFNKELREALIKSCEQLNIKFHEKGTVITIEGPRFSSRAESKMFQLWGADVINMSIAPEVILANEAGIPYAAIAMSTDYDCWKTDEEPVSWEAILNIFSKNVEKVTKVLAHSVSKLGENKDDKGIESKTDKIENISDTINSVQELKEIIRTVPNWPKPGIMFRDVTTLIKNPQAFAYVIEQFKQKFSNQNITKIAGIEARGFIFGAALAHQMNLPFVPIRKKGKLPAETVAQEYALEYGTDKIEIHKDAIENKDRVLIVDDLLATGGTSLAACQLVEKLCGEVAGLVFVVNLPELKGAERLTKYNVFSLVDFEGE